MGGARLEIRQAKRLYPALRERLKDAGYNQRKLGELIGSTIPMVSMKLGGQRQWKQTDIEIIASALGLTWEEIGRMFFYKRGQDQYGG